MAKRNTVFVLMYFVRDIFIPVFYETLIMIMFVYHAFKCCLFLGSFLHLAKPSGLSCPNQNVSIKNDPDWKRLTKLGMLDPQGEQWKIQYSPIYVMDFPVEDKVKLKLALTRDAVNENILGAGAIYRKAEMYNGGTYKVRDFVYKLT